MAKIYFAVAGEYGCGYFNNYSSAERATKYVGNPRYVTSHFSSAHAARHALQMFLSYNIKYDKNMLRPLCMRANKLYFRKDMLTSKDEQV